ncbi:MAG: GTPase HflX [Verrucomicrobiota bacterium]|nr:GTPase HflX [Verrucomicrobiota bacterium]
MLESLELPPEGERALLVGIEYPKHTMGEAATLLDELRELVTNLGLVVADAQLVRLREPHARFLIGSGKAEELMALAKTLDCGTIIFDDDLAPAQQRNWQMECGLSIMDRQEVILDIFSRRAHTKEANLQVELARLEYALPRLRNAWSHLSRQRGGGSVTQRGEGEAQLELDHRMARDRIAKLKRELEEVVKQRATQRKLRQRIPVPTAAIVGYTNAGKSTLLRALTGANVYVADKLFATLDPSTRQLILPDGQKLLVTDTVGFVRRLPHRLVEAFKATLEEAVQADFLIHVIDASSPDAAEQAQTTLNVLKELGAEHKPILTIHNKLDKLDQSDHLEFRDRRDQQSIAISAATGEGIPELLTALSELTLGSGVVTQLLIPHSRYDIIHRLHSNGCVREEKATDDGVLIVGCIPQRLRSLVEPFLTTIATA